MAFKTNSIRLKEYADNSGDPASYDGTATDGDLAIVGSTLKLRTGGNWVAISGGGGGSLNNVVEDTAPQLGGDLDANGNDIDMGTNVITDVKVGQWDTAYSDRLQLGTSAGEAMEGNTPTISVAQSDAITANTAKTGITTAQSDKLGHISVTQAVDLDLMETQAGQGQIAWGWGNHGGAGYLEDSDFNSAGLMTTNGAGGYSITPTSNFSTVDDLNDLSDVSTPSTLDAAHVGKAVGVANTSGVASVISFAVLDLVGLSPIEFRFSASGQTYRITFTQTGAAPVINDTNFAANIATLTTDNGATVSTVGTNLRTLLTNAFDAAGYAISGTGGNAVLTADAVGPDLAIVLDPSNPDITITETTGVAAGYQYELINTSGAPDPNWNHVQNIDWGGNLTLAANTASNISWVNTYNAGANELLINAPSDYGVYSVITVMNASNSTMDISTVDNTFDFNCQQLNPTQNNTITLDIFQKAILVKTSGTDWEVILASI